MDKTYSRINWENEPSVASPINAVNLNKMDYAIDEIDNRIIQIDTTKANQQDLLQNVKGITYDTASGVFVFTWQNGTSLTVDLNIEKIPVSFSMSEAGVITMTTTDGSQYTADVSELIKEYSFEDSGTIEYQTRVDEDGNKHVKADIVDGSVTADKLQPNYLADVTTQATNAKASADNAKTSEDNAKYWAEEAEKHGNLTWTNVQQKPFETLNPTHFEVSDGELSVIGGGGGGGTAESTTYDNTTSGLDAENVQDAIDEVSEDLTHKTMYGTSAEFDAIKDDSSIPIGSSFDITDDYDENIVAFDKLTETETTTIAPYTFRRQGANVYVSCAVNGQTIGASAILGTLPISFRPIVQSRLPIYSRQNALITFLHIEEDGTCQNIMAVNSQDIRGYGSYIAKLIL